MRRPLFLVGALVVLALAALASLALGTRDVALTTVFTALLDTQAGNTDHMVVLDLRIPRTLVGIAVGAALGLAGAIMQGVTRNPLADPGILGVNAGASLFVVIAISLFGITSPWGYVWFAFAGAAVATVVVYAIGSSGRDGATPVKLALAGAALTATVTSLVSLVLLTDVDTLDAYRFWAVGSLAGRDLGVLLSVLPFLLAGAILAIIAGRVLNVLSLGDDVARGLGQSVARARTLSAIAIVLLCGASTAIAGPIVFVGLAVPHIARRIAGPDYRWIVVYSLALGPILLLAADVVGRLIVRPGELEAGIVVAFLGAPVMIALIRRSKVNSL